MAIFLQIEVSKYAELRNLSVANLVTGQQANVAGYASEGDGGQGLFVYDSTSSAADNDGTILAPTAGTGRWLRLIEDNEIHVDWFGPTHTDAEVQAAIDCLDNAIGGTLVLGAHTYTVANNITARGKNNFRMVGQGMGISILDSSASNNIGTNPNVDGYWGTLAVGDVMTGYTSNIYLADFKLKVSSNETGIFQKGLLLQCTENLTIERVWLEGGSQEGFIGFGAGGVTPGSAFEPRFIRVHQCRFTNRPKLACFQVFGFSRDISLTDNTLDECYIGLFAIAANVTMTGNRCKNVKRTALAIGEPITYNTGRTYGASVIANNVIEGTGDSEYLAQNVAIYAQGATVDYADGREDVGLIISNNSIINLVQGTGQSTVGIRAFGCAKVSDNYLVGASGDVIAIQCAVGGVPDGGTPGPTRIYLENNIIDKTQNDEGTFGYFQDGIYLTPDSGLQVWMTGNRVQNVTRYALYSTVVAAGMPFISLNGDILNSQFHIPGAWSNVLNLQNVSGELNNTPLFGNNAGSVSTPTSIDIYRVDGDAATPDVKGRHILYLVNNAGSPTTNFLNGVEGQEITIVAILTAASVIQNNANILLNGSANFSMDTGDTLTLLYVAGKWYEKSRSVH